MMASAANILEIWKGLNKAVDFIYILKIWMFLTDFHLTNESIFCKLQSVVK